MGTRISHPRDFRGGGRGPPRVGLAGDWLVVARGPEVFAYDFATKRSWTVPLTTGLKTADWDFGWLRVDGGRVFVNTSAKRRGARGELLALDLATGQRVW